MTISPSSRRVAPLLLLSVALAGMSYAQLFNMDASQSCTNGAAPILFNSFQPQFLGNTPFSCPSLGVAPLPQFQWIPTIGQPLTCNDQPASNYSLLQDNGSKIQDPDAGLPIGMWYISVPGGGSGMLMFQNGTLNTELKCSGMQCQGPLTGTLFNGQVTVSGNTSFMLNSSGFPWNANITANLVTPSGNSTNNYMMTLQPVSTYAPAPCVTPVATADPISTGTGEFVFTPAADLSLGGPLPVEFRRYYSSYLNLNGDASPLGYNWMHNFDARVIVSGNTARVMLFGGGIVDFQQSGGTWHTSSQPRLAYQLVSSGNGFRFLSPGDNLIYTFSQTGALLKIEDRNGNALTITPSAAGPMQVSDGLGRTLAFVYSNGQLVKVQDQSGRSVSFSYSGNDMTGVTDANGNTTTFAYTTGDLLIKTIRPGGNAPYSQTYDNLMRVSQQTDSLGNRTTLAYNPGGNFGVTVVTDPLGRTTRGTYQDLLNISTLVDAAGQSMSVAYDAQHRPNSVTDRLGNKHGITYDPSSGYIASRTGPQGNIISFAYQPQSQNGFTFYNLSKITYPDGTSASVTYDGSGNVLTATDRAGKTTTYTYNSRGQVATVQNAAGGVTAYTYNSDATLATVNSPAGDVITYTFDDKKRPSQIQYADGTSRSFTWDALDQLLSATDERGKVLKFTYDANTNPKSVTDALGQTASLVYDTDDLISTSTDPLGKVTRYQYNSIGLPTTVTNPAREKITFAYDALERVTSVSDSSGKGPSFAYDAEGRLATFTDALANTVRHTVDKVGRVTRVSTPLGENFDLSYDALGRLTTTTNPLSQKATYGYEKRDLLASVTLPGGVSASYTWGDLPVLAGMNDPNGSAWSLTHDSLGRLISLNDPLGRTTSYTYDQRNHVSTITNPVGTLQILYDAAGNLVQKQYADGTTVGYSYDDDNRVTGGNGVSLAYDAAGRIVASNSLSTTRDALGRIASVAYSAGSVNYTYDSRGLLATISDWLGGTTNLAYDNARRLISITRPNGVTTQYTYDKDGRRASITDTAGGNTLASIALQRDALGRVVSSDRNLPQAAVITPGGLPLGYDAAHQVAGFNYDGMGRLVNGDVGTYTWDQASRLTSYSRADGSASFTYDDFGQRISRTGTDGTTVNYVLNYALGRPSVAVVQTGGADLRYYVYLPEGTLLYSIEAADGSHHFYSFDESGNTTFLTDDSGSITDSYGITPYGESVTQVGSTDNPFTFQGQWGVMQESGTSLYYMRFRYYDSTSARFLTRDPMRSIEPKLINPYQYAAGDPIGKTDPLGLKPAGTPVASPQVPAATSGTKIPNLIILSEADLASEQQVAKIELDRKGGQATLGVLDPSVPAGFDSTYFEHQYDYSTGHPVENQVSFRGNQMSAGEFNYY
jgi:RHS repeat-associated protein